MSYFLCPACGEVLEKDSRSYKCKNNHCYDMAKSGYVNLLLNPAKNSNSPGDNKLMVNARRDFLDKGYYKKLSDEVNKVVFEYLPQNKLPILDVGCGEGYYTENIAEHLKANGKTSDIAGIDISKFALDKAAKRCKDADFAVASIFHLPFAEKSCGTLINIFAPFFLEEFSRVLSDDGVFIMVIPGEDHLWELKSVLYENPYKNEVKDFEIEGFSLCEARDVKYRVNIESNADLQNLFKMTPYYYKSPVESTERLNAVESLDLQLDFKILVYRKK